MAAAADQPHTAAAADTVADTVADTAAATTAISSLSLGAPALGAGPETETEAGAEHPSAKCGHEARTEPERGPGGPAAGPAGPAVRLAEQAATARAEGDMAVTDRALVAWLVSNASVVCGLHPDGATEPLVDWAIEHGKPFVVVPCCVFWRHRPNLLNGGVRSHEDFLRHLVAKRPPGEIRRGTLAFDGRNTVLWWMGRSDIQDGTTALFGRVPSPYTASK